MQKKYLTKQICIKLLRLFVLIKTYEISVSILKYPQISIYFSDIRFSEYSYFFEAKQIEKLDIRDIRSKSQITSKTWISDPCPGLVPSILTMIMIPIYRFYLFIRKCLCKEKIVTSIFHFFFITDEFSFSHCQS